MSGRAIQTRVTDFDTPSPYGEWTPGDGHGSGPQHREFDPVDVSLATLIRPQWLRGYEDPVVALTGADAERVHKPDPTAQAVATACTADARSERDLRCVERAVYEGWRDNCEDCFGGDEA